jgi:hypothetical protein
MIFYIKLQFSTNKIFLAPDQTPGHANVFHATCLQKSVSTVRRPVVPLIGAGVLPYDYYPKRRIIFLARNCAIIFITENARNSNDLAGIRIAPLCTVKNVQVHVENADSSAAEVTDPSNGGSITFTSKDPVEQEETLSEVEGNSIGIFTNDSENHLSIGEMSKGADFSATSVAMSEARPSRLERLDLRDHFMPPAVSFREHIGW